MSVVSSLFPVPCLCSGAVIAAGEPGMVTAIRTAETSLLAVAEIDDEFEALGPRQTRKRRVGIRDGVVDVVLPHGHLCPPGPELLEVQEVADELVEPVHVRLCYVEGPLLAFIQISGEAVSDIRDAPLDGYEARL